MRRTAAARRATTTRPLELVASSCDILARSPTTPVVTARLPLLSPHRDFAGRLVTDPARLSRTERLDVLQRLAGALQTSPKLEQQWLGRALGEWIDLGGDFARHLDLHPRRGSRMTITNMVQQEAQDRRLVKFAGMFNTDCRALEILRGERKCPPLAAELLHQLKGAPCSAGAIKRARTRLSRHR
jgi:hypothetical protein